MSQGTNSAIAVIIFFSLTVMLKLGFGEVQPWDEGLYALRAKSILINGEILDQTELSPGGLYSSTYPPLPHWITAAAMGVFGENAFALRFFSGVCSSLTMLFVYLIALRYMKPENAVLASVILISTTIWDFYGRQGMTDVPLTFFFVLCWWALLKLREAKSCKMSLLHTTIFALSFASALMTKIIVSLLPLLFVLIFIIFDSKQKKKTLLMVSSMAALVLGSMWYFYMAWKHGAVFTDALLVPHMYSSVEGNSQALGVFYYFNQLIVANPLYVYIFVLIVFTVSKKQRNILQINENRYSLYSLFLWFIIPFAAFSLSVTKLAHYLLYILPPATILLMYYYEKYTDNYCSKTNKNCSQTNKNNSNTDKNYSKNEVINEINHNEKYTNTETDARNYRQEWFLALTGLFAVVWSFLGSFRNDVKLLFSGSEFSFAPIILITATAMLFLLGIISSKDLIGAYSKVLLKSVLIAALTLSLARVILTDTLFNGQNSYGAVQTAEIIYDFGEDSFVYLYHEHNAADSLNPQLSWYLDGWMCNWQKNRSFIPCALPEKFIDLRILKQTDNYPEQLLIYYLPGESYLYLSAVRFLSETRPVIEHFGRYVIFGKKRDYKKERLML